MSSSTRGSTDHLNTIRNTFLMQAAIARHCDIEVRGLERFAFYERAKKAFVVVQASGERRPYGEVAIVYIVCIGNAHITHNFRQTRSINYFQGSKVESLGISPGNMRVLP